MAQAARWCPDATESDIACATARVVTEIATSKGLASFLGLPATHPHPTNGERELLDAVDENLRTKSLALPSAALAELVHQARLENRLDPIHPLGWGLGASDQTCGTCAWANSGRCLQTFRPGRAAKRIDNNWPACARWEVILTDDSCGSCGACCRQGYSLAPVKRGEAMRKAHPEWIRESALGAHLPRPNGICVALCGDGSEASPWRCRDYPVRMRACAELAAGSKACLIARRRTGLSR